MAMNRATVKRFVKEMAAGAAILFVASNLISYLRKPEVVEQTLPVQRLPLLDGSDFFIEKNRPVMIHFWATWCPACRMEAANIERLSHTYEVVTVAVNSGDESALKSYLKKRGLTFRVVNDATGEIAERFGVKAFPTTFIYDRKGMVVFTEVGYTTTAGLMARMALVK